MKTYVVWIEMDLAKVFGIQIGEPNTKIIHRREIKHHTSRDPKNHKNCARFFSELAEALRDADEILLIGPGLAKEHFRAYLATHHLGKLSEKVVRTESSNHVSDRKILELSGKFFKARDVFEPVFGH